MHAQADNCDSRKLMESEYCSCSWSQSDNSVLYRDIYNNSGSRKARCARCDEEDKKSREEWTNMGRCRCDWCEGMRLTMLKRRLRGEKPKDDNGLSLSNLSLQ